MRINLNAGIGTAETTLDKTASSRPASVPETAGESQFAARELQTSNLAATVLAAPEMRQEKVSALRTQMENGTYSVSSAQIASSMFEALCISS